MVNTHYLHDDKRLNQNAGPWFTHEYINYFSLLPHNWLTKKKAVKIETEPEHNDWEVGPAHENIFKEFTQKTREINPLEAHDISQRNSIFPSSPEYLKKNQDQKAIKPWKIIMYYCTVPDLDLDCDLDLSPTQVITGGSHGHRHMQFKLLGKTIGVTDECFVHYKKTAIETWKNNHNYWGYRYLSRATHYLADLGHPFHVKIMPFSKLPKFLFKLGKLRQTLTTAHNGHEVYTQYRFRTEFEPFKISLVEGSKEGYKTAKETEKEPLYKLKWFRNRAKKRFKPLYNAIMEYFGSELIDCYDVEKLDPKIKELDYSKQCMEMEHNAQDVIFHDPNNPGLKILDKYTIESLRDVGFMLGLFFGNMQRYMPQ